MLIFKRMFAICAVLITFALPVEAQNQCGVAASISFPVDPAQFQVVQDFGVSSPRHQGRYHTGEDWYGARGSSYGTYVRAIANGRITFSSPNGWGRDGGVIIIEHTFPDSTVAYSMYGHITDETGVIFPAPFTCIREGDIIAAIGAARPAPHLHLEIRTSQPDIPGAGYTWDDPMLEGLRRPSKFIANWQAWFQDSTLWHTDIADEAGPVAPPIELGDHGLLALDAGRVLRISHDGRVLWRVILDQPAVGLFAQQFGTLIAYANGSAQVVNDDSSLGQSFELGQTLDSPPMVSDDLLIFHTPDNQLAAFDRQTLAPRWQIANVAPILRWAAGDDSTLGFMTADNAMLTISQQGELLDQVLLREPGSLSVYGSLIAYTRGGLWRVAADGEWSLEFADAPPGGRQSATLIGAQESYLFDGTTLRKYTRAHELLWETSLPGMSGDVNLSLYDGIVLLTSNHGDIIAVQASSGGVCNATDIYGSTRSREWHSLGDDGVLRVYVADQIIGLDWQDFLLACG